MENDHNKASSALGSDGPFAAKLAGFKPRSEQLQLSSLIEQAIEAQSVLVAEAGTGTGKTFAYLVPAVQSGKKVIISTGTRNLQDQLFHRDLPQVLEILQKPVKTALLKGRANYLCLYRVEINRADGRFQSLNTIADLQRVARWAAETRSGDIGELTQIAEGAEVWPLVTSTPDNCLGQDCAYFDDCHVFAAREKALAADVVVVNHHLFFADAALKDEGFGELLPGANVVIFDEAHQVPETASVFFGQSLSSRQLVDLAKDIKIEAAQEVSDIATIENFCETLEHGVYDLRIAMGDGSQRDSWQRLSSQSLFLERLTDVKESLSSLEQAIEPLVDQSKGLEKAFDRLCELKLQFAKITQANDPQQVHWYETFKKSFALHSTPLQVGESFQSLMQGQSSSWVFTSATLAVGEDFSHFAQQLGLENYDQCKLSSSFNYPEQALWYAPSGLPDPSHESYIPRLIEETLPVIEQVEGGVFFLFTSHRALQLAADLLEGKIDKPILVQGNDSKLALIEAFSTHGQSVLLGTGSFWEGVDVKGAALSCVVIDKLPFASPGDPVTSARINSLKKQGKNAFWDYQLPSAVISLKQGAGRLIRDHQDRGILITGDPRLVTKNYGKLFIQSLPPMQRTRQRQRAMSFLNSVVSVGDQETEHAGAISE